MSPKQRYQAPRVRKRSEIVKAVSAAAVIIVGTALMVWLLRPGPDDRFDGGGGGLFNRQPRASWLFGLTVIALIGFVWWVFTQPRRRRTRLLAFGCVAILIVATVSGFFWPGGLLHKYQTVPEFDPSEFEDDLTGTTLAVDPNLTVPIDPNATLPPETTPPTGSP